MSCTIVDHDGSELMTIRMRDKSFPIEWKNPDMHALTTSVDESTLWHKRFDHFNYASLKYMYCKNLTQHMSAVDNCKKVCVVCQFEK